MTDLTEQLESLIAAEKRHWEMINSGDPNYSDSEHARTSSDLHELLWSNKDELLALARVGAAMQWRPISEASEGDKIIFSNVYETLVEGEMWCDGPTYFGGAPGKQCRPCLRPRHITHFIPLSAIPPAPQEEGDE